MSQKVCKKIRNPNKSRTCTFKSKNFVEGQSNQTKHTKKSSNLHLVRKITAKKLKTIFVLDVAHLSTIVNCKIHIRSRRKTTYNNASWTWYKNYPYPEQRIHGTPLPSRWLIHHSICTWVRFKGIVGPSSRIFKN